ncbi:MAG: hypothetical protein M5R38_02720 [Candidatus Methylomirabilis sp.]|nr:hypothetical protein [Candidatus Methylomirabilis sp.]
MSASFIRIRRLAGSRMLVHIERREIRSYAAKLGEIGVGFFFESGSTVAARIPNPGSLS